MKPPPPPRADLLADVLAEAQPADFRAALLGETLRLARRRRHFRQARRVATVAATVALGLFVFWPRSAPRPTPNLPSPAPELHAYALVTTQPLPAAAIVRTQPLSSAQVVASQATVALIHTERGAPEVRLIDDRELLALSPRPAALIRLGPGAQELIFTEAEALR